VRRVKPTVLISLAASIALVACGPAGRPRVGDDDSMVDAGVCQPKAGAETTCNDNVDDDCDGKIDCHDPDCSGVGDCPICGMVMHPLGQPLALPDGDGAGPPYTSKLHFDGFGANQTFTGTSNIKSVCVNMEHSWIRDLEIDLLSPDGKTAVLSKQLGNTCPGTGACEVYLGQANDADSANMPVPGVGAQYCWTPTAMNPAMLDYANMGMTMLMFNGASELPPGDYKPSGSFDTLIGSPLNGDWQIFVQDKWGADNGYIFEWSISFDPLIVQNCDDPVIQ
jgi:hypothetical protein